MLQNQITKIRIFFSIREVQKVGPLQPMCSQQFTATLVLSGAPQTTDQPKPVGINLFDAEGAETEGEGRGDDSEKIRCG